MAINTTRLSQKIGKIIGGLNEVNTFRGTTLAARVNTIYAQYASASPTDVEGIFAARDSAEAAEGGFIGYLRSLISTAIISEVQLDRLLSSPTVENALVEWARQMVIAGDNFSVVTPTLTPADVGVPTGDHTFVWTAVDGTGQASDLVIPDVLLVKLENDDERNGTLWAEGFSIVGKAASPDATDFDYPTGSGVNTTVTAIDPAAGTTLTVDPSFDAWTGNVPDNWTIFSGTGGVNVFKVLDDPRDGADGFALRFLGDGTNVLKVRQVVSFQANTVYTVHARVKKAADPGADWTVSIRLVNTETGSTVLTSAASSASTALAANWSNIISATWVTPTNLPVETAVEIVFHASTGEDDAAVNGADGYVDWVNVVEPTELYTNGPRVTIWSGLVAGVYGDTRTLTATIPAAVSTYMIRGIDRLLNLSQYSVRLPTNGAGTQQNSLIS